jgi:lipopolysaccharide export system permease protein
LRILFIGNSRIGDFILSSGLLAYLIDHHRDARITVVCGRIVVPLLAETPNIERVIVLEKRKHHRHWLDLWLMTVRTRWDLVIDLRNSAVSRLLMAGKVRRVERVRGKRLHRVEKIGRVLDLDPPPDPRLWLSAADRNAAAGLIPDGPPVLALGPGSTHEHKRWPSDRFAELAVRLTGPDGILPGGRVAVIGSPVECPHAVPVLAAIDPARRIDLLSNTPLPLRQPACNAARSISAMRAARCTCPLRPASRRWGCSARLRLTITVPGASSPITPRPRSRSKAWLRRYPPPCRRGECR